MFAKEKINSFLNTNSIGGGFQWERKHFLLTGIIVVCVVLLIKPQWLQWLTTSSLNLGLVAGGFHALNFLINITLIK